VETKSFLLAECIQSYTQTHCNHIVRINVLLNIQHTRAIPEVYVCQPCPMNCVCFHPADFVHISILARIAFSEMNIIYIYIYCIYICIKLYIEYYKVNPICTLNYKMYFSICGTRPSSDLLYNDCSIKCCLIDTCQNFYI
jgi:hypothetical protein